MDPIDRQDAVRIVDNIDTWQAGWRDNAIESLKALPSAQPERKKGAWMSHPNREFMEWDICTACGVGCKRRDYEDGGMAEYNYHYCPNCGADMRCSENPNS